MIMFDAISKSEAARYMGVRGEADPKTAELLDKYEPIVRAALRPAYVYREGELYERDGAMCISDTDIVLTGESVRQHLDGCTRAIILAATVSASADALIRRVSVTDTAGALAVDCLCSAAIEQVCNKAEEEIFSTVRAAYRTWRFSPGYGDLPIELQASFLTALNANRRIGLTVTDSCMLLPTKSVTAIIGISETPVASAADSCAICRARENCGMRAKGGCGRNALQGGV